jgi:hypothetical protein
VCSSRVVVAVKFALLSYFHSYFCCIFLCCSEALVILVLFISLQCVLLLRCVFGFVHILCSEHLIIPLEAADRAWFLMQRWLLSLCSLTNFEFFNFLYLCLRVRPDVTARCLR